MKGDRINIGMYFQVGIHLSFYNFSSLVTLINITTL
jgi:hypothetical protein